MKWTIISATTRKNRFGGYVSRYKYRNGGLENYHGIDEKGIHSQRGIFDGIKGSFFFSEAPIPLGPR